MLPYRAPCGGRERARVAMRISVYTVGGTIDTVYFDARSTYEVSPEACRQETLAFVADLVGKEMLTIVATAG